MARITATVGYTVDENGNKKQVQKSFYGKTKAEAKRKRDAYFEGAEPPAEDTANVLFDMWFYNVFANDSRMAQTSLAKYAGVYELYMKNNSLFFKPVEKITALELQSFVNNSKAPHSPKKMMVQLLRKFFTYLEVNGLAYNRARSLVVPQKETEMKESEIEIWTDDEIDRILHPRIRPNPRFRWVFLPFLLYYTGIRISEAMGLKHEDFDLEGKTLKIRRQALRVGKIGRKKDRDEVVVRKLKSPSSYRTIPMSDALIEEYKKHIEWQQNDMKKYGYKTDFLFTTKTGRLYDRCNVSDSFKAHYKRIRVPYKGFHTYRHTFATKMAKVAPIKEVSAILGHSDISVTAKYYVRADEDVIRAAIDTLVDDISAK